MNTETRPVVVTNPNEKGREEGVQYLYSTFICTFKLMDVYKNGYDVLDSRVFLRNIFKSLFYVYRALSKHFGIGRILESYANPRLYLGFA